MLDDEFDGSSDVSFGSATTKVAGKLIREVVKENPEIIAPIANSDLIQDVLDFFAGLFGDDSP